MLPYPMMVSLLVCRDYVGQANDRHIIAGLPLVICEPLSTSLHQIAVQLSLFLRNTAQVPVASKTKRYEFKHANRPSQFNRLKHVLISLFLVLRNSA